MKWKLFTWDWKEQPPVQAICDYIVAHPGSKYEEVNTDSDEYAGAIVPAEYSPQRVQTEYDKRYRGEPSEIQWEERE